VHIISFLLKKIKRNVLSQNLCNIKCWLLAIKKGRPNDNAHIERFNRTIQEECTGNYYLESESLKKLDDKILSYIDFYNYHRIHLGIGYRTPAEMLQRL